MATTTADELTGQVIAAYAATPDRRLRELLEALTRHLHAFTVETGLTAAEWRAGVDFLTATGHKCDSERQEFVLLSDVLGLSSLVDLINAAAGATESTVLGPFYVPGAPVRAFGEQIGRVADGSPVLVRGVVTDLAGAALPGAKLDVWQASGNGLYDTEDPDQPRFNMRGVFLTDAAGRYEFRTVRPVIEFVAEMDFVLAKEQAPAPAVPPTATMSGAAAHPSNSFGPNPSSAQHLGSKTAVRPEP